MFSSELKRCFLFLMYEKLYLRGLEFFKTWFIMIMLKLKTDSDV